MCTLEGLLLFSLLALCDGAQYHSRKASNVDEPEQIHISLAGAKSTKVTWITRSSGMPSTVCYGTASGVYPFTAQGQRNSYSFLAYKSGEIHNVVIGPLQDNTTYFYQVGGASSEFTFKTPPSLGSDVPITFALLGDLGQTNWSASTLDHLKSCSHDLLLFAGDLSYADYSQQLWDSFGRLVQPAASFRPWMVTAGNHEMESIPMLIEPFRAYNARWSMPYRESGSPSNLFYSFEVASVHVLMLGSYTDYDKNSNQYKWLQADLQKVNRSRTPWLLALIHAPWYNSNNAHQGEGNAMMASMESLLYQARVDIIFAGHVHAYERTARVFSRNDDPCGAVHITIGDGGNREGLATSFQNPQPAWSLFRAASFGHGVLRVLDSTHAVWEWHRNNDIESTKGDSLLLTSLSTPLSGCSETTRHP